MYMLWASCVVLLCLLLYLALSFYTSHGVVVMYMYVAIT